MKWVFLCNVWLIAYVSASEHSCNGLPCADEDPGSDLSLLQTHITVEGTYEKCPLPANGRWCGVHLGHLHFVMAVYAEGCPLSEMICRTGSWELSESDLKFFGPPGQALDIGTHVGFYSLVLAAMGFKVNSFEPIVANVNMLTASLCRNPRFASNIKIHNVGLGVKNDHCIMISGDSNLGDGITKCGQEAANWVDGKTGGYRKRGDMDMRRLDDILAEENVPSVDFVKMDVEGFECEVMKGGQSLIEKYRPRFIQSEIWSIMEGGCKPDDFLASFDRAGYIVSTNKQCTDKSLTLPQGTTIDERYMCLQDLGHAQP